jgi:D-alanine transaminase
LFLPPRAGEVVFASVDGEKTDGGKQLVKSHSSRSPAGRIAYVGGRYLPHAQAGVHIEDRGLQFADSVYEVCAVSGGRLLDEAGHMKRLEHSLGAIEMALPVSRGALRAVLREMVRRNHLRDGLVYLQITRGAQPRDHMIPASARPTLIVTTRRLAPEIVEQRRRSGIAVITRPDIRWLRRDIKSTSLLPNVLAKTEARRAGAFEVWMVDESGLVTEGASTNAWIVEEGGRVRTRQLSNFILAGVTRATLQRAAARTGLEIGERAFTVAEAKAAREAFITSATGGVIPVVSIDGQKIGGGKPGPITARMHELYRTLSAEEAAEKGRSAVASRQS